MKEMFYTFHCFLLKRIICDVSIEAIASNQAGVVVQSLFCNTAFLFGPQKLGAFWKGISVF